MAVASRIVPCLWFDDQAEAAVALYTSVLGAGGDPHAQQCGWLKDKYGLSWQVVPRMMIDAADDPDPKKAGRVMTAMLTMKKLDIAALQRAAAG